MNKGFCPKCRTVVVFEHKVVGMAMFERICPNCHEVQDNVDVWFKGDGKRIESASIRVKATGQIYIGRRHHVIMTSVDENCNRLIKDCSTGAIDQGFITDAGDFVDREEALKIAVACGQVKMEDKVGSKYMLFSEDICLGGFMATIPKFEPMYEPEFDEDEKPKTNNSPVFELKKHGGMSYLDPKDYDGEDPYGGGHRCSHCGATLQYEFHWGCWVCPNC